jgi:hypothetical protein
MYNRVCSMQKQMRWTQIALALIMVDLMIVVGRSWDTFGAMLVFNPEIGWRGMSWLPTTRIETLLISFLPEAATSGRR